MITRRKVVAGIGAASACFIASAAQPTRAAGESLPAVTLHKDPNCDCCTEWGKHIQAAGFEVHAIQSKSVKALKDTLGVPKDLAGCHTAIVDGYVIEGHVPPDALLRLLKERPEAIGLAVAGMPMGSPGMGGTPEEYDVTLFTRTSRQSFGRYRASTRIG
ncbi:CopG protein [Hyphomicrobium sulfonivorans]|uniref:CopG protein n=1 Tax=Hyphomicrobium sulfonivorans TaxID=121290 RepID=A0A109BN86_HYPSL|nr:DUF411 domain-containing protein [Hyphomicrobium sulfonivorans]KWT71931.1 CopG protein [Hyphomicrobium sulfonivorans]